MEDHNGVMLGQAVALGQEEQSLVPWYSWVPRGREEPEGPSIFERDPQLRMPPKATKAGSRAMRAVDILRERRRGVRRIGGALPYRPVMAQQDPAPIDSAGGASPADREWPMVAASSVLMGLTGWGAYAAYAKDAPLATAAFGVGFIYAGSALIAALQA